MSIWQSDGADRLRAITELGVFLELDHPDSRYSANHPYVVTSTLLSDTVEEVHIQGFAGHEYVSGRNGNSKGLFFGDTNSIEYTDGYLNIDGPFRDERDAADAELFADGDLSVAPLIAEAIAKNRGATFTAEYVNVLNDATNVPTTVLRLTVVRPTSATAADVVISDSARQGYAMFASMSEGPEDLDKAINSDVFRDTIETLHAGTPGVETLVAEIRALHAQTTGAPATSPHAVSLDDHIVWRDNTEWDVKVITNTGLVSMFYDPLEAAAANYTFESTLLESEGGKTVEEVRIGGVSVPPEGIKVRDGEALFYITPEDDAETDGFIAVGNTPFNTELGCLISSLPHMLEVDEDLSDDNLLVVEAHAYVHMGKDIAVEHISNSETPTPHTVVRVTVSGTAESMSWSEYDGWDSGLGDMVAPNPATAQDIIDNNGPPKSAYDHPLGKQPTTSASNGAQADEKAPLSQDDVVAGLMAVASGKNPGQAFLDHAGITEADLPVLDEDEQAQVAAQSAVNDPTRLSLADMQAWSSDPENTPMPAGFQSLLDGVVAAEESEAQSGYQAVLDLAAKTGAKVIGVAPGTSATIGVNADGSISMPDAMSANPYFANDITKSLTEASTPDEDNPNHEWRDGVKYVKGTTIVVTDPNASKSPNKNKIPSFWDNNDEDNA